MVAISLKRGRTPQLTATDQQIRPARIDHRRRAVDRQAKAGGLQTRSFVECGVRLGEDQKCGDNNHRTFKNGGKEFSLVMAEGVVLVGGLSRNDHGQQRRHRCHDIDDALQSVGV